MAVVQADSVERAWARVCEWLVNDRRALELNALGLRSPGHSRLESCLDKRSCIQLQDGMLVRSGPIARFDYFYALLCILSLNEHVPRVFPNAMFGLLLFVPTTLKKIRNRTRYYLSFSNSSQFPTLDFAIAG